MVKSAERYAILNLGGTARWMPLLVSGIQCYWCLALGGIVAEMNTEPAEGTPGT